MTPKLPKLPKGYIYIGQPTDGKFFSTTQKGLCIDPIGDIDWINGFMGGCEPKFHYAVEYNSPAYHNWVETMQKRYTFSEEAKEGLFSGKYFLMPPCWSETDFYTKLHRRLSGIRCDQAIDGKLYGSDKFPYAIKIEHLTKVTNMEPEVTKELQTIEDIRLSLLQPNKCLVLKGTSRKLDGMFTQRIGEEMKFVHNDTTYSACALEVIDDNTKTSFTVNGYVGKFDTSHRFWWFGCASIDSRTVADCMQLFESSSSRYGKKVSSITIGAGEFNEEQIREMFDKQKG